MKLKYISAILTLIAMLLISFGPINAEATGPTSDWKIYHYADDTALYGALKAGEVDVNYWEVTPAQYNDAINDPNILLAPTPRLDYRCISLHSNETIAAYPTVKSPLTDNNFRKALHRLADREYWVNTICNGFATVLPVSVAAPSQGWWNMSVVNYVNTQLSFSISGANALLDAGGFLDTNDADDMRNYPVGWPGAGSPPRNIDAIKFYIRSDDILRKTAGLQLASYMSNDAHIPTDAIQAPFATCYTYVMSLRNYHMYTAGWSVGRFPTYLWSWFESSRYFPGGSNYHLSPKGQGGLPDQDKIDEMTLKVQYPPTYADAMTAAKDVQYYLHEKYTTMIPGWSAKAFYPYRANLLGVTNEQSVGTENLYTYMKAWKMGGGAVIGGVKSPPLEVNPIYSRWVWDVSTFVWMDGFLSLAPYNIMVDQPLLVQDWTSPPESWFDGLVEKSKMTYWFKDDPVDDHDPSDGTVDKDAEWIEPVTGNVLADFTDQWLGGGGYEFSNWYYASEPAGWIYGGYRDTHHIRVYPAEKKAEVYFNVKSYWAMYWPYGRDLYAPAWKQAPLSTLETRTFSGPILAGTSLNLPYRTIGAPVEIVSIKNLTSTLFLTKASGANDNDYEMVNGKIKLYKTVGTGHSIEVKYWARGDPAGYAPGGLYYPGTGIGKTWIGASTHYITEHVSGVGGWSTYKKNANYHLECQVVGEIDYLWYWNAGPKPRTGYYQVDVLDIIKSTYGLDGSGYRIPTPQWEAGTDLIWPGGTEIKGKTTVNDNTIVASDFGIVSSATP